MKLRLRGNSLRLRLLKSEVKRPDEVGSVHETLEFPTGRFVYALESADVPSITASYDDHCMRVMVPRPMVHQWATSDQIGLTAGDGLKILIEKDFTCLKPRTSGQSEDETDAFPNPNPSCGHSS